jgi:voltage-dependent potassium channel beta subunit
VTFHNQVDDSLAIELMARAYDAGVNFFDNAEVYARGEAERIMGDVIADRRLPRDAFCVSSKVLWGSVESPRPTQMGLSRKHVTEACHGALKRLRVDYLDLYFCHRPDPDTPVEETVRAMSHLVNQGKALYWGTSEWSALQIQEAYHIARREHLVPPTMEQPEYNMFNRDKIEREYLPLYQEIGLGTTIWSPLHSGILTGKYNNGIPEGSRMTVDGYEWLRKMMDSEKGRERLNKVREMTTVAQELGLSMAEMALAWCLKNPHVSTVITGASKPEQVTQNMKALDAVAKLTPDVMATLEGILQNKPEQPQDFRG